MAQSFFVIESAVVGFKLTLFQIRSAPVHSDHSPQLLTWLKGKFYFILSVPAVLRHFYVVPTDCVAQPPGTYPAFKPGPEQTQLIPPLPLPFDWCARRRYVHSF
jgi:hypothetical protein